jgi:predicted transcriptional regulator
MEKPRRTGRRFVPGKTGDASPLGHLESAIMAVIWSCAEPLSVAEAHAALPGEQRVAYTTVKTTMERLAAKGILSRAREGKAYLYRPAISREELERRIVSGVLDRLVTQFPRAVASFFTRPDAALSEEKLALLMEAIERRREETDA